MAFFEEVRIQHRKRVGVDAILPLSETAPDPTAGCTYESKDSVKSTRLKEIAARTFGLQDDICNLNWARTLEKPCLCAFGFQTRFFPSEKPVAETIVVQIDGIDVPQYGPEGDLLRWQYNDLSNAIDFHPLSAPSPGQTLTVTYRPDVCH